MADLTTLTSPFTAAQARSLLAIGLEDVFPLYVAEVDPDEPDLTTPAGRHELMRSLDDVFDQPSLTRIAADTLRGWRADEWLL
jgi:hypothetical protein